MTATKEKAASPCQVEAAQKQKLNPYITPNNPLQGWVDLSANGKESRANRRQKRYWKRGRK